MANSFGDVRGHDDVGEAFGVFILDSLLQTHFSRLSLAVHLAVIALDHRDRHAQAFAGLQLRSQGKHPLVLDVQFGIQLGEDENLRAPILGVRRTLFQSEQRKSGRRESQTAQAVAPFLLGPDDDEEDNDVRGFMTS